MFFPIPEVPVPDTRWASFFILTHFSQIYSGSKWLGHPAALYCNVGLASSRPRSLPTMCFFEGAKEMTDSFTLEASCSSTLAGFSDCRSSCMNMNRLSMLIWCRRVPTVAAGSLFLILASWSGWKRRRWSTGRLRIKLLRDPSSPVSLVKVAHPSLAFQSWKKTSTSHLRV